MHECVQLQCCACEGKQVTVRTGHAAALPCDLRKSMSNDDRFDADMMMLRVGVSSPLHMPQIKRA